MDFRFAPLAPVSHHFSCNDAILDVEYHLQDGELMRRASMHTDYYEMITGVVFPGGRSLGNSCSRNA